MGDMYPQRLLKYDAGYGDYRKYGAGTGSHSGSNRAYGDYRQYRGANRFERSYENPLIGYAARSDFNNLNEDYYGYDFGGDDDGDYYFDEDYDDGDYDDEDYDDEDY